ncbi:MAG: DUF2066 domain-containing protein [Micavibrio aeruginosavorus]|uniref:DUF2066 domain-containing protein n=1 Tax=Micavibrio aeruginosavorus TaxID=349221 RepID=A0A7T5R1S8_9BACT|nr:MAG: DUF2066 domain-containing protein [Micavibrio aeruginosavorus]
MARHYRFFQPITSFVVLLGGLFLFSGIVHADDPLFTVHGVKVDVTAASAVEARTQAFEKAQQDAFKMLAERLLPQDEAAAFVPPPGTVISPMVKDFEITGEQLSRVQYIGTYSFRFKDNAIKAFFADKNVSFTDIRSKPVLILPFLQAGRNVILWGETNPWLGAWGKTDTRQGLVPVQVPIGDLADVSDIKDDEALTYDAARLRNIVGRYGAGEAIIVMAHPKWQDANAAGEPQGLDVMIYRTDTGAPGFVKTLSVAATDKMDAETIFDTAVRMTRQTFQSDWKEKTVVSLDTRSNLKIRVRFASLREWSETQKVLRDIPGVSALRVVRLAPKQAEIELTYGGAPDRLRMALAQSDIILSEPMSGYMPAGGYNTPASAMYDLYMSRPPEPAGMTE